MYREREMQDKQKKKNQRKMMKGKDRNERQAIQRVEAAPHLQLCSSLLAVMPAGGWWLVAGGRWVGPGHARVRTQAWPLSHPVSVQACQPRDGDEPAFISSGCTGFTSF